MKVKLEEVLTVTMSIKELNILVEGLERQLRDSIGYDSFSPLVMHIINTCKTFSGEDSLRSVESYLEGALSWEEAVTSMNPELVKMYKTFAYYNFPSDTIEFFKELNDILKDRINDLLYNYESDETTF